MKTLFKKVFLIGAVLLFHAFLTSGCSSDGGNSSNTNENPSPSPSGTSTTIESITISSNSSTIAAEGSATLTATPKTSGNPTLKYTWNITSGDSYAYFGSSGTKSKETETNTISLTAKNTTTSAQTVKVTVTATDKNNTSVTKTSSECTITISAGGTTPPSSSSKSSVTLKFLDGNEDLKVSCEKTSSGYTFKALAPDSNASYTYAWYLDGSSLDTKTDTCTLSSEKITNASKIFVTAVDSALPGVTYSAEYGF